MQINQTIIHFPELAFRTRDAHKLRGYFGNIFKEHSPLLHNHFEDGSARYAYPLVQYKVIGRTPMLVGLNDGAQLLTELFLKIKEIDIDGKEYEVNSKNITSRVYELGKFDQLTEYRFETLWMALNQTNFRHFSALQTEESRAGFLNRQLQNNILSFYKGIEFYTQDRIMATGSFDVKTTQFKNNKMLAFSGKFVTNALIPDYAGIGKAVSRGFGTVIKNK